MISFRYHVVSLVAVLLALAVGIALGGGPLQRDSEPAGANGSSELVDARATLAHQERQLEYADAVTRATAPTLVRGALDQRAITLVSLPGAREDDASRIIEAVETAGGEVTAHADVSADLLDVDSRQLVDELGTQMMGAAGRAVEMPDGVSAYERMGRLLAYALGSSRPAGEEPDEVADGILAAVSTADLVATRGALERRGSLVVVIAGDPLGTADQRAGAGSVLAAVAGAFAEGTDGAVVAGPMAAADEDGLVTAVRTDARVGARVSSVDSVERAAGAIAVVLALAAEADGESGHYGAGEDADGAIPSPLR